MYIIYSLSQFYSKEGIMGTKTAKAAAARINVALPEALLQEFRETIPARQRNQFIVELIQHELQRRRFAKAWDEAAGAWSDEDYPHLKTAEDIDRWVRNLREQSMPRSWDEIIAEAGAREEDNDESSARHERSDLTLAQ
jgi:hypothetical protein